MTGLLRFLREATTPADRAVLILVWTGMVALAAHAFRAPAGTEAVVVVEDRVAQRIRLAGEHTVTVQGARGPTELRVVADGRVRFVHSPCDAKLCIRAGWQSRAGELAACVPNQVLVRIRGQREVGWDALNY